jgi:hypothetical protein
LGEVLSSPFLFLRNEDSMDQNKLGLLTVIGGLVKYAGMCTLTGFSLAAGGLTGWMLYKSLQRWRATKGSDQVGRPDDQEMQQKIYRKEEDSHEEILEETG